MGLDMNKRLVYKYNLVLSSLMLSILIFAVFFLQKKYTGQTYFAAFGDQQKLCYPAFVNLGKYLCNQTISGVDITTWNGASEFFLRSNLTVAYLPLSICAVGGTLFDAPMVFYIVFHMVSFYIAFYYAQKVAIDCFNLKRITGFLLACSCLPCLLYEIWYMGFGVIVSLVFPMLYASLKIKEMSGLKAYIFVPFVYVLAFTSGYITVSVILVGIVWISAMAYFAFSEAENKKRIMCRLTACVVIGGIISLLYYYGIFVYVKKIVNPSSKSNISFALGLPMDVRDLAQMLFSSYQAIAPIESGKIIYIGIVWAIVIILAIRYKSWKLLDRSRQLFCLFTFGLNLVLCAITLGIDSILAVWFYALIPVLGQMHLTIRYMIISIPLGLLGLCILYEHIFMGPIAKKWLKYAGITCVAGAVVTWIISLNDIQIPFNSERLILELLVTGVIIYLFYENGLHSRKAILIWACFMLSIGVQWLYDAHNLMTPKENIQQQNICYNQTAVETLNSFLQSFPKKRVYRYMCADVDKETTPFISQNYPWLWKQQDCMLSNYLGYEQHLCVPVEYLTHFPWFGRNPDTQYMMDTRCDFLVLTQEYLDEHMPEMNELIDWDVAPTVLQGNYQIYKCKKFIPSVLTEESIVDSIADSLDNGFFYSCDLHMDDLLDFNTDNATYFTADVNAEKQAEIVFLPYASQRFQYYMDGARVFPDIVNMQAVFQIPEGEHEIKVKYQNMPAALGVEIIYVYYGFIILCSLGMVINKVIKKTWRHK